MRKNLKLFIISALAISSVSHAKLALKGKSGQKISTKLNICESYASSAVSANRVNLQKGCGFKGPKWSSVFAGHKNWCDKLVLANGKGARAKLKTQGTLDKETASRNLSLRIKCKKKKPRPGSVSKGGKLDMRQGAVSKGGKLNMKPGKGFGGKLDMKPGKGFGGKLDMKPGTGIGGKLDMKPGAGKPMISSTCKKYGQTARQHQMRNFRLKCGFNGPKWNMDGNVHSRWCASLPNQGSFKHKLRLKNENGYRENKLQRCRVPGKPNVKPGSGSAGGGQPIDSMSATCRKAQDTINHEAGLIKARTKAHEIEWAVRVIQKEIKKVKVHCPN